jgi:nucleoid DNA-binding protein
MTQSQVMEHLVKTVGITKKNAKQAPDELNMLVVRELKKEGSIKLAGMGIFRKRKLAAAWGAILPPVNRLKFRRARACASRQPTR